MFGGISQDLVDRITECSNRAQKKWSDQPQVNFSAKSFRAYYCQRIAVAIVRRYSLLLWNKARRSARDLQHDFEAPTAFYSWADVQDRFVPEGVHGDINNPSH